MRTVLKQNLLVNVWRLYEFLYQFDVGNVVVRVIQLEKVEKFLRQV